LASRDNAIDRGVYKRQSSVLNFAAKISLIYFATNYCTYYFMQTND